MKAKHRTFGVNDTDETHDANLFGFRPRKYTSCYRMLDDVDRFLTELGPERIISVSSHADEYEFVRSVVVWYWEKP